MLYEDLDPEDNQNGTANEFGFGFIAYPKDVSDFDTDNGDQKSCDADQSNGRHDMNLQEGKGHANGQGIDAGSYGQYKHGFDSDIRRCFFFVVFAEGFPNHIPADQYQ